jgi:hypothetical protein
MAANGQQSGSFQTNPDGDRLTARHWPWIAIPCGTIIAMAVGIAYVSMTPTVVRPSEEIADILQRFVDADRLILYSIEGNTFPFPPEKPNAGETFHGCPVLGKVDISDPAKRKAIIAAVEADIRNIPSGAAACFWPHHAVRAKNGDKSVDLLICFHCSNFQVYSEDIRTAGGPMTTASQSLLNQYLAEAGVSIGTIGTK